MPLKKDKSDVAAEVRRKTMHMRIVNNHQEVVLRQKISYLDKLAVGWLESHLKNTKEVSEVFKQCKKSSGLCRYSLQPNKSDSSDCMVEFKTMTSPWGYFRNYSIETWEKIPSAANHHNKRSTVRPVTAATASRNSPAMPRLNASRRPQSVPAFGIINKPQIHQQRRTLTAKHKNKEYMNGDEHLKEINSPCLDEKSRVKDEKDVTWADKVNFIESEENIDLIKDINDDKNEMGNDENEIKNLSANDQLNDEENNSVKESSSEKENNSKHKNPPKAKVDRPRLLSIIPPSFYDEDPFRVFEPRPFRPERRQFYVRPSERYKAEDMFLMRRHAALQRGGGDVSGDSYKINVAFSESARKKRLVQLIEDNTEHITKEKRRIETGDLQERVDEFIKSITDFVAADKKQWYL